MSKTQQIVDTIAAQRGNGLNTSEAEILRWAVWEVWADLGAGMADRDMPSTMTSSEWADACETVGIKRGTALNRHSEARRNWEAVNG